MKLSRPILMLAVIASILIGAAALGAQGEDRARPHLGGRLSGLQEVPVVLTAARGDFRARVVSDGGAFEYVLRVSHLGSDVQEAHIHIGQVGANGGVAVLLCDAGGGGAPVCPAAPRGEVSGLIMADDVLGVPGQGLGAGDLRKLLRAMKSRATYVNVHTAGFPSGEIRGQIRAVEETAIDAVLHFPGAVLASGPAFF